jgi:CIC family chloride channel protein
LPIAGAWTIAALYLLIARGPLAVGIVHVMERLAYFEGYLRARNALYPFLGGAIGLWINLMPLHTSHAGLYAMLRMGAMMGATLQAPLAALLALLELTGNPNIIMPGMLAIVSATLSSRLLFNTESVFLSQMRELGLDYANDPISQSLRRRGIMSVMSRSFVRSSVTIDLEQAESLLADEPQWIVIDLTESKRLLPATQLARHLEAEDADSSGSHSGKSTGDGGNPSSDQPAGGAEYPQSY